jgi:hypothetical protein
MKFFLVEGDYGRDELLRRRLSIAKIKLRPAWLSLPAQQHGNLFAVDCPV